MLSLATRTVYSPHPEYHGVPPCVPDAPARYERVVNLLQAYGGNYWHLCAEVLPRLRTLLPLVLADGDATILLPPSAAATPGTRPKNSIS